MSLLVEKPEEDDDDDEGPPSDTGEVAAGEKSSDHGENGVESWAAAEEAAQGKEGPASDEQAVVLAGDWLFGGKKGLGLSGRATKHHR
ncbi:hypothetical protein S40293_11557 [Stachybotrys chartarum IBT 40293]|nr:hypothetical protein S40293_11557 [Stachybotrys chartarum IBT 40293]